MTEKEACFKRHARLLDAADFSRVFNNAQRSSDRLLTVLAVNNELKHPRLGLAISKKNARRAVDRNRIKRIIRESFRLQQANLPAADFVVMAKPITKQASNSEIFKSLEIHWNRLRKLCEKSSSA